ncbi:MAG: class I SAM-dependent methyltransferase [Verrucomicrobiota bacterium]|jgi:SAM-dependent methyltransferase
MGKILQKLLRGNRSAGSAGNHQTENKYERQLTEAEISSGEHRQFVGGMWEEIGSLQFEFLKKKGLAPRHRLIDIGCGCLRGGVYFVPYLEQHHYYGIDINASLIEAGKKELFKHTGNIDKKPDLRVTDRFDMVQFGAQFDYALAISVFTHLYANHIGRCLVEIKKVLVPGGKFFATFFLAPDPMHLQSIHHELGGIVTYCDRDPFHYSLSEMEMLAGFAGLSVKLIGDWGHPRDQQMLCFTVA